MGRPKQKKTVNSKRTFAMYVSPSLVRQLDHYVKGNGLHARAEGLKRLLDFASVHGGDQDPESGSRRPSTAEYLAQLLDEKEQLAALSAVPHSKSFLDDEISRVKTLLSRLETSGGASAPPDARVAVDTSSEVTRGSVEHNGESGVISGTSDSRDVPVNRSEKGTGRKLVLRSPDLARKKTEKQSHAKPSQEALDDHLYVLIQDYDSDIRGSANTRSVKRAQKRVTPALETGVDFIVGEGWTLGEVTKLKRATKSINPVTREQWASIASSLGTSRPWEECKMYAEVKLHYRAERPPILAPEVPLPAQQQTSKKTSGVVHDAVKRLNDLLKYPPQLSSYKVSTVTATPTYRLSSFTKRARGASMHHEALCSPSASMTSALAPALPLTSNANSGLTAGGLEARKLAGLFIHRRSPSTLKNAVLVEPGKRALNARSQPAAAKRVRIC